MSLTLKKGGLICEGNITINSEAIMQVSWMPIEIGTGVTLRDFFKMLEEYPIFQSLEGPMPDHIAVYKKCPRIGCIDPNIKSIGLSQVVEIRDDELDIWVNVSGVPRDSDDCHYAVDFMPLNKILDLPLEILPAKLVFHEEEGITWETKQNSYYSLMQFVQAIADELCFHGAPQDIETIREELAEITKKIDNGEMVGKSIDDIMEEIKLIEEEIKMEEEDDE